MMFLVAGFQTLKHVNIFFRFRTALPHEKKKQKFDQEVLTPVPPLPTVIGI